MERKKLEMVGTVKKLEYSLHFNNTKAESIRGGDSDEVTDKFGYGKKLEIQ